jgi:hypothetical protein
MPQHHRSSIAVTAFYATSTLVASLGLTILIASASVAYAIAQ